MVDVTTSKDAVNVAGEVRNRPLDECPIHNQVIKNEKKIAADADIEWTE